VSDRADAFPAIVVLAATAVFVLFALPVAGAHDWQGRLLAIIVGAGAMGGRTWWKLDAEKDPHPPADL